MPAAGAGAQLVPIVVIVVVVGLALWWLFRTKYRLSIAPGGLALVIPTPANFVVTLDSQSTRFSSWTGVAGATVSVTAPAAGAAVATANPPTATMGASGTATFAGVPVGEGKTTFSISASDGKNTAKGDLPVSVT